jgi:hypothetical protein
MESSETIVTHDTIGSLIKDDSLFNKRPGEPVITDYEAYSYYMSIFNAHGRLSKTNPSYQESIVNDDSDSCWYILPVDDCYPYYREYIEGPGGPCYSCEFSFFLGHMGYGLVYYKKGDVTWGTPYVISDIEEINSEPNFELYPNPVTERLFIKTTAENIPYTFSLWDLSGKLLYESVIEEIDCYLTDINPFAGFYYYRIIDRSGRISSG